MVVAVSEKRRFLVKKMYVIPLYLHVIVCAFYVFFPESLLAFSIAQNRTDQLLALPVSFTSSKKL